MSKRRAVLLGMASAVPAGFLAGKQVSAASLASPKAEKQARNIFRELGVRTFINAAGPYSILSGAQMWPEVIQAMHHAKLHKARMGELHDAVGKRIAELTGAEAAMVTAGATSAMILGTAACVAGSDPDKIHRLPDIRGMKSEIIFQKGQAYPYMRALHNCGTRVVLVETEAELVRAVNSETAMLHFAYAYRNRGRIDADRFVEIGKQHGIPVFCDAATMIPPAENIGRIVDIGFDLVCFSGGKGLRGPYNGGLLLGRKDLVAAARLNSAPNDAGIGRGMKVSKEVLIGMLVALEKSLSMDLSSDVEMKTGLLSQVGREVEKLGKIETRLVHNQSDFYPNLRLTWDQARYPISPEQLKQTLRTSDPAIEVVSLSLSNGHFEISAWMMEPGEERIVARRIGEILGNSG